MYCIANLYFAGQFIHLLAEQTFCIYKQTKGVKTMLHKAIKTLQKEIN